MTSILFVRKPHVYLPEISAYKTYLNRHHPSVEVFESTDFKTYNPLDFDILWHFMGMDISGQGRYVVHEYNSLSTQPFATIKNAAKSFFNAKPDQRVFLSKRVEDAFHFKSPAPHFYRDMGVDDAFFHVKKESPPKYDFVYAGGLNRGPVIQQFFDHFAQNMKEATLLVIGDAPKRLKDSVKNNPHIIFHGRAAYQEMPKLMAQARYGLNIMPDIYPFNIQTATKVLEYAALGLPIVTTDYKWIRSFEDQYRGRCFRLNAKMDNLSLKVLKDFDFKQPDITGLRWDNIIDESGVFDFLKSF